MAEAAEGWVAEYDPQLFLMAVVATATVLSMVIFIAVKGRGRSGYPIFKEKSVGLTIVHLLAGLVWTWSSMVVDEHLKPSWLAWLRGSDFSLCVFWAHWCQVCLGWGLWMSCSFTRNYRLYKRDVKREEPVGFVIHLCVFNFPWFLIVLVDQILFNTRYEDGENPFALKKDHCMYSEVPWEVHSLYLYMMFCLFLFISMRGRGYGNRFNDYYQTNLCMLFAAVVWLVILVQIFTHNNYSPNGRLVKTGLILLLTTWFAVRTNIVPIVKCLTGNMDYLDEFEDEYELDTDPQSRFSSVGLGSAQENPGRRDAHNGVAAGWPRDRREDSFISAQATASRQQRIAHLSAHENQFQLSLSHREGESDEDEDSAAIAAALIAQHSPEGRGATPEGALRGVVVGLPRREP